MNRLLLRTGARLSAAACLVLFALGIAVLEVPAYGNSGPAPPPVCTGCTTSCSGQINGTNCYDANDTMCSLTCECSLGVCK
jgi:hypothetical protein